MMAFVLCTISNFSSVSCRKSLNVQLENYLKVLEFDSGESVGTLRTVFNAQWLKLPLSFGNKTTVIFLKIVFCHYMLD